MQTARQKKAASQAGRRSFTWGIQGNDIPGTKPGGAAVIDGSSSSDSIAITASDRRRRRKPVPFSPV
jgi:hypothetical protein